MKKSSVLITASVLAVSLSGLTQAQESLRVATYGGPAGDALRKCVFDKFTAQTGVQVIPEPGTSGITLAKLEQQRGNPSIDVAYLDGGISELAEAAGVLAPIDPSWIKNINNFVPKAVYKNNKGEIYALSSGYYSLALTYRTDKVKNPPRSWKDLWNKDYAGAVTIPSPSNAMGLPFMLAIAKTFGSGYDDTDAAIARLHKLKVSSYFKSSGAGQNLFQSGEAIIGAMYRHTTFVMQAQGIPVASVVPIEGAVAGDIRVHLVKGTKNQAIAEKFLNVAASREALECNAKISFYGPPLKKFKLSPEVNERMPWGATGNADNLITIDWTSINSRRDELVRLFNQKVVGR